MNRLLIIALLAIPATAAADGIVLRVDGPDIYVDLGTEDGVGPGTELTLHHVIEATHPVTGKRVRDTFPIGTMEVWNAGAHVSVAMASDDAVGARATAGDAVTLVGDPRAFPDPWEERSAPPPAGVTRVRREREAERWQRRIEAERATIADREAAERAWQATLGKSIEDRVEIWKAYLRDHPDTPYGDAVRAELASLREQWEAQRAREAGVSEHARLRAELDALLGPDAARIADGPLLGLPPTRAYEGRGFELAFLALGAPPQRAWVYYRGARERSYRRAELVADGDGYLRGAIPDDAVAPPAVEYFVEVLPAGEDAPVPAIAWESDPARVAVDASVEPPPPPRRDRSRITLFSDVVDFDSTSDLDHYTLFEVDFMYRFHSPVYSLRLGFGALDGVGGPKDVIDGDDGPGGCLDARGVYRCEEISFHYSFAELEFRISDVVAIMARPMTGSAYRDRGDEPRDHFDALGFRGRVRLGREQETNLVLGLQLVQQFGTAMEAVFTWDVIPRVPIVLSAVVTDQPVPEDFGVRLIADVGYRGARWVYPSLRLSYQARDLDHAGPGVGLALNFDW